MKIAVTGGAGFTLNLLEAGRKAGKLARVVYAASGGSMCGDTTVLPTPESEPPAPGSPYGVSKLVRELGWKPAFDVDRGIAATIAWHRPQAR